MDTTIKPGAITSINGVRVLSMWWVILGHVFIWQLIGGNVSKFRTYGLYYIKKIMFPILCNPNWFYSFLSVSSTSYFFIAGHVFT